MDINANSWRFLERVRASRYVGLYESMRVEGQKHLKPATTKRQFATAREILNRMNSRQRGVLLADDVGLGKTTVAVLVALVFAGNGKRVRILAPNGAMARRWRQELEVHCEPIAAFATKLKLGQALRRVGHQVKRLHAGTISVSTHRRAGHLACDLLIIDEAHRTRSDHSILAQAMKRSQRSIDRVLILTATPFSIDPGDLSRMLTRIGGHSATGAMHRFARLLDELWRGKRTGSPMEIAAELVQLARGAVEAIRPYVIRHGIDNLSDTEKKVFGFVDPNTDNQVSDPPDEMLEAMLRTDRALTIARQSGAWHQNRTNDPRYHVGFSKLLRDLEMVINHDAKGSMLHLQARHHALLARNKIKSLGRHTKVETTTKQVKELVEAGEKVLIFCDHHATANELATAIADDCQWAESLATENRQAWREAWKSILIPVHNGTPLKGATLSRFDRFIDWLSSDGIILQVCSWIGDWSLNDSSSVINAIKREPARRSEACSKIYRHAQELYRQMIDEESSSTRSILSNKHSPDLPGYGRYRVAAVCESGEDSDKYRNVFFSRQPDATLAVFNSPFGPDVLVATDRLSEGIDLHQFCRHIIHHELDPSPVRTVQRNGRIRRVNCWAARTKQPIRISYPALRGTRDEKLVEIMRYRLLQFDLLLGGIRAEVDLDDEYATPQSTADIIAAARSSLKNMTLAI